MSASHNLKLPFVQAAQAQKHVTVNESLEAIDLILQLSVRDKDLPEPPAAPEEGARYIVPAGAAGAWAGRVGTVAVFRHGVWTFLDARTGCLYTRTGAGWTPVAGGSGPGVVAATLLDRQLSIDVDGSAATVDLSPLATADASAIVSGTLADDRLPATISGKRFVSVAEQSFSNAVFGGAGLHVSVADNGNAYLAGAFAPDAFDTGARLTWDRAAGGWRFEGEMAAGGVGVGGARPDGSNRLAVASPAVLFGHAGSDVRVAVNKAGSGDTASLVFQTGWSGRAEFGLSGSDDFSVKVLSDGALWRTALDVDAATGRIAMPHGLAVGGSDVLTAADAAAFASAVQGARADSAVQPGRTVLAGPGLVGGGDLSGDRTLSLDPAEAVALMAGAAVRPLPDLPSAAAFATVTIPAAMARVVAGGHSAENDGPETIWQRVAVEPLHGGKRQDLAGAWFELVTEKPDPRMFGARCDLREVSDAAIDAGSSALASPSAGFKAVDVGRRILVAGAGIGGGALRTTIASVAGGIATLAAPASTTVSGARCFVASDDSAAFRAAWKYAREKKVLLHLGPRTYYFADFSEELTTTAGHTGIVGMGRQVSRVVLDDAPAAEEPGRRWFTGRGTRGRDVPLVEDVVLRDFTIRGTWDFWSGYQSTVAGEDWDEKYVDERDKAILGVIPVTVQSVDRLVIDGVGVEYCRHFAMAARKCRSVHITNTFHWRCAKDAISVHMCDQFIVADNEIWFCHDDAIAFHTTPFGDSHATNTVLRGGVIANNRIFGSQGIVGVGGFNTVIVGNKLEWCFNRAILLLIYEFNANQEGCNAVVNINVTGNVVSNLLNRDLLDDPTGVGGFYGIAITTAGSTRGSLPAMPGDADTVAGGIVDWYDHIEAVATSSESAIGPAAHITVENNHVVRTANTLEAFSDLGYGPLSVMTDIAYDPAIGEAIFDVYGVHVQAGRAREIVIRGNRFAGIRHALSLAGKDVTPGAKISTLTFENNDVWDVTGHAIVGDGNFGAGGASIYVIGNRFDLDPLLRHPARANDGGRKTGGWTSAHALAVIGWDPASTKYNVLFERNIVRNASSIFGNVSDNLVSVFDNVVECDPVTVGAFHGSNKGVGCPPRAGVGWRYRIVECDPRSAMFGTIRNECPATRTTMPGSGTWPAGALVWDETPAVGATSIQVGWHRLTTGAGAAADTDWAEVHLARGAPALLSRANSFTQPQTVFASGLYAEACLDSDRTAGGIGRLYFRGRNAATPTPEAIHYAMIAGVIDDATDGSEDGEIQLHVMRNGVLTQIATIDASSFLVSGVLPFIPTGGIRVPAFAAADIANRNHACNAAPFKAASSVIRDATNNRLMVASGGLQTDSWWVADGSASIVPA